jgi:hypothetical protein
MKPQSLMKNIRYNKKGHALAKKEKDHPWHIWCSTCLKGQPMIVDFCLDETTKQPFIDLVCGKCLLVLQTLS